MNPTDTETIAGPGTTISIFLPHLKVGGAERAMLNVAKGLDSRGYRVRFLLAEATGGFLESVPSGIEIVDLNCPQTFLGPESLGAFHLARHLRKSAPDVLLSAMPTANVTAILAVAIAGVDVETIICEQNTPSQQQHYARRVAIMSARFLYPHADHIVAVSDGVATDLSAVTSIDRTKIKTIYNPVVTESINEISKEPVDHPWFDPDGPPVVLNVGNMRVQKDLPTLVHAFDELRESRDARLVLVGDGNVRPELEELVADLGLSDDVAFLGYRPNEEVYKFMGHANVFALSSEWEGLPTVLIEALACGCPIVSTDCPSGPKEILANGKYGQLVPVGDPSALARGLSTTLDGPATSSEELIGRASNFSIEAAIDSYEELFTRG